MSITRRADYAVRIMYELAQLPEGTSLSVRDVCEMVEVPESFAEAVVESLAEAGLVHTAGHRGQLLSLAVPADALSMADIIRTCDPKFSLSPCTLNPESCPRSVHCGVHQMWGTLDHLIWQHLESVTLGDVASGTATRTAVSGQSTAVTPGLLGTA